MRDGAPGRTGRWVDAGMLLAPVLVVLGSGLMLGQACGAWHAAALVPAGTPLCGVPQPTRRLRLHADPGRA